MDANGRLKDGVQSGNARRVKEALGKGADPALLDEGGTSPLHLATAGGDGAILQLILEKSPRGALDRLDATDRTPLMCAVEAGNLEAVRLLLDAGANPNARDGSGNTALRLAATIGTPDMVQLLMGRGGDPLLPGRMMLNALDRARERRTPEGWRIVYLIERHLQQKPAPPAAPKGRGSRKPRLSPSRRK